MNAAQPDGMTALHWAAERNSADLASMLVYAGANVAAVTRIGQYTPLHVAAAYPRLHDAAPTEATRDLALGCRLARIFPDLGTTPPRLSSYRKGKLRRGRTVF